ncbi:MAG TPA: sugar isomerase [Candidatus Paceibacterota bacterium]|nr:sugar isomerase [Candidatus Paceibacterota bacterium]HRZ57062.1 sugar isomerase [Candidatus Paceibacterota bacterium]
MQTQRIDRRHFVIRGGLGLLGALTPLDLARASHNADTDGWDPTRPFPAIGRKLRIQPVLMYHLPTRRDQASWKSWGGVQTEAAVTDEIGRIERELTAIGRRAEFPHEFLPLARVTSVDAARALAQRDWDVTLVYACTGGGNLLEACLAAKPDALIFVRHRSGPVYYWYEALSTRFLARRDADGATMGGSPAPAAHVDDVVVDDPDELLWRLRALFAVNNLRGARIVALGGAWGKYAADAPRKARERYQLDIVEVGYDEFEPRLRRAREDGAVRAEAERAVDRYLRLPRTRLATERRFVVNAFVLYRVFKELMAEHKAPAFTIRSCMGTIIPMSETTACLTLGLLNDEGAIAFCESDFVIIPAGLLLRYIAGRPVFLHNSTFPHRKTVTCAHCTCPRRLDGRRYEPTRLVTHYESDYGAATKVDMPLGQEVTFIDPEYSTTRWLGFRGIVRANPDYAICRSQQDVEIQGDWRRLIDEARDSHWMMVYGDFLRETGYAARKLGLQWVDLSTPALG